MELYIQHGRDRQRCGYTTGSCATAAAKAAAMMLFKGKQIEEVQIATPKGIDLTLIPVGIEMAENSVKCGIVKNSGDDPDITNGITVFAKVTKIEKGILIKGGTGVGKVTKKGLDQPVGSDAINSVPRKMIAEHLREVMEEEEYTGGLLVEISIPQGEEIAKKTFNPRLGIEGGISVIGTTGIVEPMSTAALVDTIRLEENILREQGRKNILIALGNYGKTFLKEEMPEIAGQYVTCSNYIGDAIDIALEMEFEGVLIVGHIGKLVKVGAGIMNTHSANADARIDILMSCGVRAGMESHVLRQISDSVTVDDAIEILMKNPLYERLTEILMERIEYYLKYKVKEEINIGAVTFSNKYGMIGKTSAADDIRRKILEEENG